MEIRKRRFLSRLKAAVGNFSFANEIIKEKTRTAVKYFAILSLIICSVMGFMAYIVFDPMIDIIQEGLKTEVPDFEISNGKLKITNNLPYVKDNDALLVVVDSTGIYNIETLKAQVTTKDLLFFTSDRFYYYSPKNTDFNADYPYSLLNFNISKTAILSFLENNNIALYIAIYVVILNFIIKFLGTLFAFILSIFVANFVGIKLKNSQLYALSLYALTLPSIFNVILNLGRMRFIYYLIVVIYLYKYMQAIKRDQLNNVDNDDLATV